MRPFVMNSNICTSAADVADYDTFMNTIAGNTGNSYITYALLKELGCELADIRHIPSIYTYDFKNAERDIDIVNNECTHFILVLQDQIRIHESYGLQLPYQGILDFVSRVKKPILIAGLGANSLRGYIPRFHEMLSPELVSFLRSLAGHVQTLGVRGYYTAEILEAIGIRNYAVIGCPSYYETGRNRVIEKKPWSDDLRVATSSYVIRSWVLHKNIKVYLQDRQPQEDRLIRHLAYGEPLVCSELEKTLLAENRVGVYSSIRDWKVSMSGNDFFAGYRVHGSILALNSGVPAVVVNGDSRAREMCEFLNIPYFPWLESRALHELYDLCDYTMMNSEYERKYEAFEDFVSKQGFEINPDESKATVSLPLRYNPDVVTVAESCATLYRENPVNLEAQLAIERKSFETCRTERDSCRAELETCRTERDSSRDELAACRADLEASNSRLCRPPAEQGMVEWYRNVRMSEWPIGRLSVIFGWHLFKWINPFSSLHREIRNRRRMEGLYQNEEI